MNFPFQLNWFEAVGDNLHCVVSKFIFFSRCFPGCGLQERLSLAFPDHVPNFDLTYAGLEPLSDLSNRDSSAAAIAVDWIDWLTVPIHRVWSGFLCKRIHATYSCIQLQSPWPCLKSTLLLTAKTLVCLFPQASGLAELSQYVSDPARRVRVCVFVSI